MPVASARGPREQKAGVRLAVRELYACRKAEAAANIPALGQRTHFHESALTTRPLQCRRLTAPVSLQAPEAGDRSSWRGRRQTTSWTALTRSFARDPAAVGASPMLSLSPCDERGLIWRARDTQFWPRQARAVAGSFLRPGFGRATAIRSARSLTRRTSPVEPLPGRAVRPRNARADRRVGSTSPVLMSRSWRDARTNTLARASYPRCLPG